MDKNLKNRLKNFEKKIGVKFKNKELLYLSLVHKSYSTENELDKLFNNERLEFLGDSVLSIVVSAYLYFKFPNLKEGKMSKIRSVVVSKPTCYAWAKDLRINNFLLLGKGEEASGGREKLSNLGNAFESVIGAMYLDKGYKIVEKFLTKLLDKLDMDDLEIDYKSKLQEVLQKQYKDTPIYKIHSEIGPAHKKKFKIKVVMKNKVLGAGEGFSKKKAEQFAAKDALHKRLYKTKL